MKIFATYQDPTGDLLELSSGITEAGTHRVVIHASLPLTSGKGPYSLPGSTLYLSKAQALDLADAMKRAAMELP